MTGCTLIERDIRLLDEIRRRTLALMLAVDDRAEDSSGNSGAALKDGFSISRSTVFSFRTFHDPARCYGFE